MAAQRSAVGSIFAAECSRARQHCERARSISRALHGWSRRAHVFLNNAPDGIDIAVISSSFSGEPTR